MKWTYTTMSDLEYNFAPSQMTSYFIFRNNDCAGVFGSKSNFQRSIKVVINILFDRAHITSY